MGARTAVDEIASRTRTAATGVARSAPDLPPSSTAPARAIEPGVRVTIGTLGLEGTVLDIHGSHAEVDVRGKRLQASLRDLRPTAGAPDVPQVRVNIDLQPRDTMLSDLNVVGCTVDDALARVERFLDESTVTDQRTLRVIHGHGTGQLRRAIAAFLKDHPLVARFESAPNNQGGGGVTVVELKD